MATKERSPEIDGYLFIPLRDWRAPYRGVVMDDGCVIHQDIYPAPLVEGALRRSFNRGLVGNVHPPRRRLATSSSNLGKDLVQPAGVSAGQSDLRAFTGQRDGDEPPDAHSGAGHQGDFFG